MCWIMPCGGTLPESSFLSEISRHLASREQLREVVNYGVWNLAITGGVRLISYTDALVIAAFMPIAAVAPFAIAANLRSYFEEIFMRAGFVFFPAAARTRCTEENDGFAILVSCRVRSTCFWALCGRTPGLMLVSRLRSLVAWSRTRKPSRLSISCPVVFIAAGWLHDRRRPEGWLSGPSRNAAPSSACHTDCIRGSYKPCHSVALVRRIGLLGVAAGTLIPAMFFQGMLQPFFVCRSLHINWLPYVREVLVRPFIVLLGAFPIVAIVAALHLSPYQLAG